MTHRMPSTNCPSCGKILDAASLPVGDDAPTPGDVSVCLYCGHLMVFGDDMRLRAPTDQEIYDLAGDPDVLAIQRARGMAGK